MLEVLAVVPARGGSKGLPRKNLLRAGAMTLVARAVAAALESSTVTRVVGSTDDEEIAQEMRAAGAEVPFLRPAELAGDDVPDAPVFLHALEALDALDGYRPDIVVNVRPTAPLRTGADIDAAVDLLARTSGCRSVKSVSPVAEHPYKMWTMRADDQLEPVLPAWHDAQGGDVDAPRQSLPEVLRSNGAVDAVWADALRSTGRFHPGPIAGLVMERERSIDVDTEDDLAVATARLKETTP